MQGEALKLAALLARSLSNSNHSTRTTWGARCHKRSRS